MKIGNERVAVDTAIVPLIRAMNNIPGLVTTNCCQAAYVQFTDADDRNAGLNFMQQLMAVLVPIAEEQTRKEERYEAKHGPRCGSVSYELHISFEIGYLYCISWLPPSYPYLLKSVRKVAKFMKSGAAKTSHSRAPRPVLVPREVSSARYQGRKLAPKAR